MARELQKLWASLGIPADYDRRRGLPVQRGPRQLEFVAKNPDGRAVRLTPAAARAWRRLQAAARQQGIELVAISGFRSIARQTAIIRGKLESGQPISSILRYVAAPGCSEHHTGRAIDIGTPSHLELNGRFARTKAFRWLRQFGPQFGFTLSYPGRSQKGIGYEPWHWLWTLKK